jgi:hypothetical protein
VVLHQTLIEVVAAGGKRRLREELVLAPPGNTAVPLCRPSQRSWLGRRACRPVSSGLGEGAEPSARRVSTWLQDRGAERTANQRARMPGLTCGTGAAGLGSCPMSMIARRDAQVACHGPRWL